MNKDIYNKFEGEQQKKSDMHLAQTDLGVMLCASCKNSVPFQSVRWSKKRQTYLCFDCMKA